ncbi:MAG: hypothetical protein LBI28_04685 [Treponema sp.]|jgi:flagellar basal body rod protein FlgF|nr:hypothetical protein [Treponema sp.]
MKRKFVFFVLFAFSCNVYANDNDLLNEYRLLYADISNIMTIGYKSHFNNQYNRAYEIINMAQGSLYVTEMPSDVAITGEGYFKIRLENDAIGWTRAGSFIIDENGNIITNQRYYLYDNINLPELSLPETLKITRDGNIYVSTVEGWEIVEVYVGQLLIYNVPSELLVRYNNIIYVIKDGAEYNEELSDSRVFQGSLEMSNVILSPVIMRMYYILSVINESYISNIELKKELLKIQIESMAHNSLPEELLLSIYSTVDRIEDLLIENYTPNTENEPEINNVEQTRERLFNKLPQRHMIFRFSAQSFINGRLEYLFSILPYLDCDN